MNIDTSGQVILKAQALKKIMLYAKRFANDTVPRSNWKEVYGVLIGKIKGMNVFVHDAEAITAGDVTEVRFSNKEYENLLMLDEKISAKNDGTFICGWWHTHPFPDDPHSLFLSDVDVRNHLGYQGQNPLAIALVHDPSKLSSRATPLGLKIFRLRSAEVNEDDFDKMLVDADFYKENDNTYYYSVPFVLSNVTPAFFVQSLVELYDKALAGEPPALAFDEEWHKVEMIVE